MSGLPAGEPAAGSPAMTHEADRAWTYGRDCPYQDATLHELITDQARRTPGAEAIRQWDHVLTYRDLVEAAESVAARLRREGVRPEVRVGICLRRTMALPVAVLGVLLAGGAYVPLDPNHPPRRLADLLTDAEAGIALVDEPGRALLAGSGRHLIDVSAVLGRLTPGGAAVPAAATAPAPAAPAPAPTAAAVPPAAAAATAPAPTAAAVPAAAARPGNAAYVMYTSGSTGRPKGVVVSHRNLVAFAAHAHACSPLPPGCRSAGFSSLAFDAWVFDVFVPLTLGAAVQLVPDEDRVDAARLSAFLAGHRVTRAMLPPAVLPLLEPAGLPDLADIYVAGEPCGPEQVERWTAAGRGRFHNWYGPTETTVIVVSATLDGAWHRPLPIGRPLPGCQAWVMDEQMRPCPAGAAGELLIGGPQLTRCYLGQPGQTAERFVPHPFGETPGSRLYRTGDLVRWEADGRLSYLGRIDRQVKIQGQRVEIGEVETVLQAHPAVRQAVAEVAEGPAGLKHLIGYVAPAEVPDLREWCASRLPVYMTPTRILRLERLPLNASGKVDMAALHAAAARDGAGQPPRSPQPAAPADATPEDLLVARVWAEVFEIAEAGRQDEFIASGGHSLMAMRLTAALRSRSGRQLSVEDVYRGRTVAGLASILRQAAPAGDDVVPAGSPPVLGAAQRRMWFVEQLTPGRPMHNVAMAERLRGHLDIDALRAALGAVTRRHEALRWRVVAGDDGAPQVAVDPPGQIGLTVADLTGRAAADQPELLRGLLDREAMTVFALASGPLWRAALIRLAPDEHVLAITVHHIVFDGWSRDVLYADIGDAYQAALAGQLASADSAATCYADYVAWSARRAERQAGPDLGWWLDHLAGAPLVLDLPRDFRRPPVRTFGGAMAEAQLAPAACARVREVAQLAGATPFAVLLSAFAQLACRLTGQQDLIIGTPAADRGNAAFGPVIGLCLHMLPLRLQVCHDASFTDHVRRCREELAAALAHPDAALDRIVESLGGSRDLSRNPVFQVLFNGYDLTGPPLRLAGLEASAEPAGLPGSLFDLTLYVGERDGRFGLQAVYDPGLYTAARIEALLASYTELVTELTADPLRPAGAASMRHAGSGLPDERAPLPGWAGPGVLERVRSAALAAPGAPAVTGHGGLLRYGELSAICDRTAAALLAAGVAAGQAVAVLAERDVRLPAILLGVLARGARWLVLDGAAGDPRLPGQLAAAGAAVLIRFPGAPLPAGLDPGLLVLDAGALAAGQPAVVDMPQPGAASAAAGQPATADVAQPGTAGAAAGQSAVVDMPQPGTAGAAAGQPATADMAQPGTAGAEPGYLSLTSGSTGEPKPVVTSQRPLAHFLDWYARTFGLGPQDRFALLSGLAHDPSLRDMFTPLVLGGCLCVPSQEWLRDPVRLAGWLRAEQVTVAHLTPQAARLLTMVAGQATLPQLRLIALAGDMAAAADVAGLRVIAPGARIVNFYGTTETPQAQAWHDVSAAEAGLPGDSQPEGRPGDGRPGDGRLRDGWSQDVQPRDVQRGDGRSRDGWPGDGRPLPVGRGIDGAQLLVAGPRGQAAGVGELGEVIIRSRYLANGYLAAGQATGSRFTPDGRFMTGDLGRYLPDGTVVLAGRADRQVKIRGFRVESGEVEAVLAAHPDVGQACVTVTQGGGERQLWAHVVPAAPGVTASRILDHLRAGLPGYAVPAGVSLLPALPLTPNGKVDFAELRRPAAVPQRGDTGGFSTTERLIAGVWSEVLGVPRLHTTDNFFEVGGHSMAIVAVSVRLSELLGRAVPVVDLFRYPVIRSLAAHIDGAASGRSEELERAALRAAQRRDRARSRSARQSKGVH